MAEGYEPQPAESLLDNKISGSAKIIGFANKRYLKIVISEANSRYGTLLAVTKAGMTHFDINGGAPVTKSGSTTTATYDSTTGTYEFDFSSQYQHGVVILGGSIVNCVFTFHN